MKYWVIRGKVIDENPQPTRGWRFSWTSPVKMRVGDVVSGVEITEVLDDADGLYRRCAGEDKGHNRKLVKAEGGG